MLITGVVVSAPLYSSLIKLYIGLEEGATLKEAPAYTYQPRERVVILIGDLNHGMQRWIDWNMILNRKGGPRYVPCSVTAPLIFEEDTTFTKTRTYEYLSAFARTIQPGCVRIGSSVFSPKVEAVPAPVFLPQRPLDF